MLMLVRVISCFVVAAAFSPDLLSAQSPASAVVEIAAGAGAGLGGEYDDRGMPALHVAASVRFRQAGTMAAFAELSADWLDRGHKLSCRLGPTGSCIPWYPGLTGVAATIGVIARPKDQIEFRLGAGAGIYEANTEPRTGVGAIVGQLDAAFFPWPRLGLVAGGRAIVLPRFRGNLLAVVPVTAGIRIR
jgi:hypothetical protein